MAPTLSRRIYARRAALAGLLIAATLFFALIQGHLARSLTPPIVIAMLCFAALFSGQLATILATWMRNPFLSSRTGYCLIFLIALILSPLLAPTILALSAIHFLRASG
ncbi:MULTISPECIES: hypothetical protein [unclassified Mesorhizobium]|uniref:hypothetical protein n=1 Tax=unclassified Mesorhizobium TaxID=325217 RepID=UPI000FD590C1|nr:MULTISPECIES: hypothetical protein [unclassified Mesorhizobium]RUU95216.1 hypothetical protein EOA79_28990 [Mesorhizobium sp. M1A.F.Ca.IN.020.03.2.1]RWG87155.1 MAG: hypothetical protein EOQ70_14135 [Mesorhizobium sp.]RWK18207.1 MAG: hypothetical protein EOR41_13600 [Mesorhizobium sp.]